MKYNQSNFNTKQTKSIKLAAQVNAQPTKCSLSRAQCFSICLLRHIIVQREISKCAAKRLKNIIPLIRNLFLENTTF